MVNEWLRGTGGSSVGSLPQRSFSPAKARKDRPMKITKAGTAISVKGAADWFTGTVRIDAPFQATEPARVGGATVTFEPGARTAWHTHPLGQTLIVTAGLGWIQREGGRVEEIRPDAHRHRRSAQRLSGHMAGARLGCRLSRSQIATSQVFPASTKRPRTAGPFMMSVNAATIILPPSSRRDRRRSSPPFRAGC